MASARSHLLYDISSFASAALHLFDRICCMASARSHLLYSISLFASAARHLHARM
jgi:hypothetical protein